MCVYIERHTYLGVVSAKTHVHNAYMYINYIYTYTHRQIIDHKNGFHYKQLRYTEKSKIREKNKPRFDL